MWITSEPLDGEEAKAALAQRSGTSTTYIRNGQIEILDYSEWYTLGGSSTPIACSEGWVEKARSGAGSAASTACG